MKIDISYPTLRESNISGLLLAERGKVSDVYDLGDKICIVRTDRISTHDVVYDQCIPHKGFALTQSTIKGFNVLKDIASSHLLDSPDPNVIIVRKAEVYKVEAIVRGIITGSAWKDYKATGQKCGIKLPPGLKKNQMLPEEFFPLFTPSTKAGKGEHDQDLTFEEMCDLIGDKNIGEQIRDKSLACYLRGFEQAKNNDGLLGDTKFEWAYHPDIGLFLVDEALTHDSSRYVEWNDWEKAVEKNENPPWADKQVVRDYAESQGFTGEGKPPHLPDKIIEDDINALGGAYRFLTGEELGMPPEPPTNERIKNNLKAAGLL